MKTLTEVILSVKDIKICYNKNTGIISSIESY